jgi:plastocyanin
VTTGSQIKVTNKDSVPHTFTVTDTSVDVELDGGHSSTADLSSLSAGTYEFRCVIHPSMTGTLIVS